MQLHLNELLNPDPDRDSDRDSDRDPDRDPDRDRDPDPDHKAGCINIFAIRPLFKFRQ